MRSWSARSRRDDPRRPACLLRITPAKITSWDFRKLESLPGRS